jgi:hypothetical protein
VKHRDSHPEPVDGCFGCRTLDVGVQTLQIKHGANPVQRVPVIADDGARAGQTVGKQDVHWDGRQDSTVFAPQVNVQAKTKEF